MLTLIFGVMILLSFVALAAVLWRDDIEPDIEWPPEPPYFPCPACHGLRTVQLHDGTFPCRRCS